MSGDLRARVLAACRARTGPSTASAIAMEMGGDADLKSVEKCLVEMHRDALLWKTTDLAGRRPRTLWQARPDAERTLAASSAGAAPWSASRAKKARNPPAAAEARPVDLSVNPWLAPGHGLPAAVRAQKMRQDRRRRR